MANFVCKITNMKKTTFIILTFICFYTSNAQRISKVSINNTGITESISVGLDDNGIINISPEGNIISYGMEYFSERVSNYSRLENYNGRIEMYASYDDKSFQGKVKYMGRSAFNYYASYEDELLRGKIKSIGGLIFTYYLPYEDVTLRGKIKSIGANQITFFTSFENEALRGKLKSVGNTAINYYSSFDDKAFKGKIKSVGNVSFTYYASFDKQFAGAMKTGFQTQNVGGINFVIR
jgi:hypothetical protein